MSQTSALSFHSSQLLCFVGFLFAAFAVWTTFGREPPLNCRLAVLNTLLMASFELGDFWLGNVVLSKQDILVVMFLWLLISVFYLLPFSIHK